MSSSAIQGESSEGSAVVHSGSDERSPEEFEGEPDARRDPPLMGCNAPLDGWVSRETTRLGKRRVVFSVSEAYRDLWVSVPCGKCPGCLLERSREWAVRCVHEAQCWPSNSFVTLTYGPEFLPVVGGVPTLRPRDFVLFMKRLRRSRDGVVRFLQAGEYGKLGRPHHHCLLFNCDFADKVPIRVSNGANLFRSGELEKLWPWGFSSIGEVTFESAAYVARYTLKKMGESGAAGVQARGEGPPGGSPGLSGVQEGAVVRYPEYITMSRRPGIGSEWFRRFGGDVFPSDQVVTRGGTICKPPRFYDERLKAANPEGFKEVKRQRVAASGARRDEDPRYFTKNECLKLRIREMQKGKV